MRKNTKQIYECCKYHLHLINQGIHWCDKQVKDYPKCCHKKCPYYEKIVFECEYTSTSIPEVNNVKNK